MMKNHKQFLFRAMRSIFLLFPVPMQNSLRKVKRKIFPPRVVIDRYHKEGVIFEVPTDLEFYRATSLGEEEAFMDRVLSSLNPNDVFYDIGSCIGLYAIHAAKCGVRVVAFEPDPGFRKRLLRNLTLNKASRDVRVISWAVSNSTGDVTLYTDGTNGVSPSLVQVGKRGSVIVKSNTIDNAILAGELPVPTVIKMDIEGAEMLALQGMKDLLTSSAAPRSIFIEIHPTFLQEFDSSAEACMELLKSFGYVEINTMTRQDQIQSVYHRYIV